jgi:hypothetical protein
VADSILNRLQNINGYEKFGGKILVYLTLAFSKHFPMECGSHNTYKISSLETYFENTNWMSSLPSSRNFILLNQKQTNKQTNKKKNQETPNFIAIS